MIQFIAVSSFFLQDYISFIFSLVFFFVVFFFGVVVFPLVIIIVFSHLNYKTLGIQYFLDYKLIIILEYEKYYLLYKRFKI